MKLSIAQYGLIAAAFVACALGAASASAQTLAIAPNPAMADEAFSVRASGLEPGERVTIQADLTDGADERWNSEAEFIADAQGNVDTSTQAPASGSYKEVSGPGLVWSMRPADKHVALYRDPERFTVQAIDFQLERKDQPPLTATLQQMRVPEGIRRIRLQGELHGWAFVPRSTDRIPAVLVVGGSEGGVPVEKAVWLASHGYAALALAYFRYENLPPDLEAIPLEYFGNAISWLMQQPEIDPARIAVMGTSRGGELALQLGSMYPEIRAVVAYVPANVRYPACCGGTSVPYAWTWHGQPLAYAMPRDIRNGGGEMLNAEIAVEQTKGPILMIGAEDDGVWESSRMVDEAAGRLKHAHFAYPVVVLKYPHAGHRAGLPEIIPAWHGEVTHPVSGAKMNFGGTVAGDAQSSLDAIPKVLDFLRTSLQPAASAPASSK
ncbi:MAG TPA: acyl-CoA thioester hydrolase/BAAT C-terminal domain-containing protein [Candidatus Baltobacteraceae bacterium]|nr:acyl-CoA thioester hydrolase/BAAT C-terminal domain-containing protein [Candidatus Baltobacteraceae bacterium]